MPPLLAYLEVRSLAAEPSSTGLYIGPAHDNDHANATWTQAEDAQVGGVGPCDAVSINPGGLGLETVQVEPVERGASSVTSLLPRAALRSMSLDPAGLCFPGVSRHVAQSSQGAILAGIKLNNVLLEERTGEQAICS